MLLARPRVAPTKEYVVKYPASIFSQRISAVPVGDLARFDVPADLLVALKQLIEQSSAACERGGDRK
ncbi:hypothetical protein BC363_30480 [Ensifer sp. LC384]|nr:hypothetical protein BC363_30480 [Ensifer sp. LC384]